MSAGITTSAKSRSSKAKTIALWVATGLLAAFFVFAGLMKFMNPEGAEQFAQWGYPDWFRVLIGVVEIAGGMVLLVPRNAFYAAGVLAVVMIGAVFTHVVHGEVPQAALPFVLLGLLVMVGYAHRPQTAR
jgi:putative oxidoreductase